jgi:hypothetical protein
MASRRRRWGAGDVRWLAGRPAADGRWQCDVGRAVPLDALAAAACLAGPPPYPGRFGSNGVEMGDVVAVGAGGARLAADPVVGDRLCGVRLRWRWGDGSVGEMAFSLLAEQCVPPRRTHDTITKEVQCVCVKLVLRLGQIATCLARGGFSFAAKFCSWRKAHF